MKSSHHNYRLRIAVSLILAVVVSVVLVISLVPRLISRPAPLRISGGSDAGKRHEIAKTLVNLARRKGLNIADPVPSAGSVKTLKLVADGELDLGLVQGGLSKYLKDPELRPIVGVDLIEKEALSNVRQVDTLDIEPLHLLFKPGLIKEGISRIEDLRGKRKILNLSEKGSGTHLLSLQTLRLIGLLPETDYVETNLSYETLKTSTYDKLPDAVFTVSLLRSPVARHLIEAHGYRLIEIPYGESLSIDNIAIKAVTIDRHVYGVNQTTPVETAGATLLLVANAGVSDEDVERLLETTTDLEFSAIVNRVPITEQSSEYLLHPGVKKFVGKNDPILTREILGSGYLINGLLGAILIALMMHIRSVWSRRSWELEHEKQVEACSNYRQAVSEVERELETLMGETPDNYGAGLNRLWKTLIDTRNQANHDFFRAKDVDRALWASFERYINSVISSVENLLKTTWSR